jgi:IS5 family transposase
MLDGVAKHKNLQHYVELTRKVCANARRRVLEGELVSNTEKIFSIFEPHTELIKRDKQPNPLEFGHRVLVIEDAAGFVCHYEVLANGVQDVEVVVPVMKKLQKRFGNEWRCSATVPNLKSLGHMTLSGLSVSTKPS